MVVKNIALLIFVVFGVTDVGTTANCTCSYNYKKAYKNFDTVFSAHVLSVTNSNIKNYNQEAKLELIKVYKGEPKTIIKTEFGGCSTPLLLENKE
ncbi:hypothetical protein [Winogradskyella bathintestinalis]|uniref:Uncharacterized protein n=1 Tax=Winogradskyella bathintestinalis TaxID=3035208 RepID=A0ABT7ZW44_9FLAO|nr:hypothetical protein [Winogradskyella bathintestinalis]MDN3493210.1 hypothetical protein [Winogradskyella bathintestinalis]